MNNKQLEKKVRQDAGQVKNDIVTLVGDSAARISRIEDSVSQSIGTAKEDLIPWVEEGVSHLSEGVEKLTGDVRQAVVVAAETMKKDVGQGLSQYNAKAQNVADKFPGGLGNKVIRYPWVAMSIVVVVGFGLGFLLKTARHLHG